VGNLNWPESPVVSPDGRTVAFENWGRLYLVNSEGKEGRELVTGLDDDTYSPRWSPDGQWIMFRGPDHPTSTTQLYRIRPDGTGLSRITDRFKGHAFGGDWSPDGSKIVFSRLEFGTCCAYWAVVQDLATGVETVVVDSSTGFDGRQASWSPDGKTVLFLGSHRNQWAILRVDLTTGAFGFFADAKGNRPAIWSPDGSTILFGTGDLWLMDADGGNQRAILADGMTNFEAFWTPAAPAP
jgi:Tol biopolymer transport system component